jgi:hypothetical protein
VPVLAEEAVITARAIKNSQIIITVFRFGLVSIFRIAVSSAAGTKPPANTVGWQTIIIPFQDALFCGAAETDKVTANIPNKTTEAATANAYNTVVGANTTRQAVAVPRRFRWQTINRTTLHMRLPSDF